MNFFRVLNMATSIKYLNPDPIPNTNAHCKICIVGAGVSGICTLKNLKEYGFKNVTVFEQHYKMGGIWLYDPNPSFPNAMYPTLHTNFPISFMKYPDFPFPENTELHPSYTKVYKYMESYINYFKLDNYIKYNHKIIKVQPFQQQNVTKWNVKYVINNHETCQDIFDYVIICNGHFRHCRFPKDISGFDKLSIPYIHSRSYRGIDDIKSYKNKNILLIGSGNTSSDIVQELIKNRVVKNMYHSTSIYQFTLKYSKHKLKKYENYYKIKPRVKSFDNERKKIMFDNDFIDYKDIDLIIFATGYDYNFEFIDGDAHKLRYLYKHIFCAYYPSLIYMSLPINGLTFVLSHFLSLWVAKILCNGEHSKYLPSQDVMIKNCTNKDEDHEFGIVGGELFKYIQFICDSAEIESPVIEMREMFRKWFSKRVPVLMTEKLFIPRVVVDVMQTMSRATSAKL